MPTWLRCALAFIVFCGSAFLCILIIPPILNLLDLINWNHKPSKEEKEEVQALKNERTKLIKANQRDDVSAISSKILAIQRGGKDKPNREHIISGILCLLGALYFSLTFALPLSLLSPRISFQNHFVSAFFVFGAPFVLAALFYWFRLFPEKQGESHTVWYAVAIYAGAVFGKMLLAKCVVADDATLYFISAVVSILICVVHWKSRKKE